MSKIGNHVVGIQESDDYRFGWESAERGEPAPEPSPLQCMEFGERHQRQMMGWNAYHQEENGQ